MTAGKSNDLLVTAIQVREEGLMSVALPVTVIQASEDDLVTDVSNVLLVTETRAKEEAPMIAELSNALPVTVIPVNEVAPMIVVPPSALLDTVTPVREAVLMIGRRRGPPDMATLAREVDLVIVEPLTISTSMARFKSQSQSEPETISYPASNVCVLFEYEKLRWGTYVVQNCYKDIEIRSIGNLVLLVSVVVQRKYCDS